MLQYLQKKLEVPDETEITHRYLKSFKLECVNLLKNICPSETLVNI